MYSFSEYSCFLNCPKKFYHQYVKHLVPVETPSALTYGSEFHKGVAGLAELSIPAQVGILAKRFFGTKPGEKAEVTMVTELPNGVPFKYIADAVSDDFIIEYKTTSRADSKTCTAQALSLQLRIGALLFNRSTALLRLVKKSAIRQRQNESPEQFDQRYLGEYEDKPSEHFQEIIIPNVAHVGTMAELCHLHDFIDKCVSKGIFPTAAPYACYGMTCCSYMDLCSDPANSGHLYRIDDHYANKEVGK